MKGKRVAAVILAGLCLLPGMVLAQVTASIVGTVQDTSGAIIPAAAVTVRSLETGAARTLETDSRGSYRALSLPVGGYEVTAEKTGFKTQVRTGIHLAVGQEAVINLSLEVGEVQQAVTVTGEAPIINTTTASTAGLVGEREVKDLPLNGRSFDNLITLNPGTSNPTAQRVNGAGKAPGNEFNVAGRRHTENVFLVNGIEYTGTSLFGSNPGGVSGQLLGIDAVREFSVQANTYGAQYGKRAGGQINIVTTSGTNQFHGTLFEFLRNNVLDARNFFDVNKPQFKRNDFGAAAGGPIRKDKTFIFGNYEGYRQRLTTTNVAFVPDANARRGLLPVGPGGSLVNVGLAPGMAAYFALYPEPNGPELGGGIARAFAPAANPVREDFGTVRLDHLFSEKDGLSGAYTIDDGNNVSPNQNPLSGGVFTVRAHVLSLEETHTFSPTIINTARIGFSRGLFFADTRPLVPLPDSISLVAGRPMGQVIVGGGGGLNAGALSNFGGITVEQRPVRNLFTYSDSIQIVKGKHLLNLGAWVQRAQFNRQYFPQGNGSAVFPDLQSLLQGRVSRFNATPRIPNTYSRQLEGAWYVDDTIKALPNLTISLGLRHEFTNGWNVHPLGPVNFVQGPDGVIQTQPRVGNSIFTENNAKKLFSPRIGLAWDPFGKGKTSIHAGFGTYYTLLDDLGFVTPTPTIQLTNVQFPFQVNLAPGSVPPSAALPAPRGLFPSNAKTPTVQEWSLTIEQQLTASTALSVGYVGSHGYHLLGSGDLNPAQSVICPATPCPAGLPAGTKFFPSPSGAPRLNPQLASNQNAFLSLVDSSYNSLQIDVRQRYSKGLSFRGNYSFSKALDNGSSELGGFFSNCPTTILDTSDKRRDRAPSCFDVQHRFAFSGSYELPIGQGKAFVNNLSGVADRVLSGWKLNGIVSAQKGMPFTPVVGFANSRDGTAGGADRPSLNPNFSGPVILGSPNKFFDPRAFVLPPAGTYGNSGRNTLRGPGLTEVDLSLFKDTRVSEKLNVQFRAEFFNLFNRANFGTPNASLFTQGGGVVGSAGVINSTNTTSRQIQLGLKLAW